ncbi:MAG TPA: tRNA pseudouridine synthase A [Dermatophilaceae bacterium]|nr:tRNA pseudouridine synthase A [Dermatophilaceae bacterium]
MRIRLDLAYDGTDFSGWAAQPGRRTVEGVLGAALTTLLRADPPVRLTVAGRTDAGVHARGQVAHADIDEGLWAGLPARSARSPEQAVLTRLNGILPPDVVVREVGRAPEGFDARFSAVARWYRYRLCDDAAGRDPLRRRDTVVIRGRLDTGAMTEASTRLLGLHDFAAFCRRREGAGTVRRLLAYGWARASDGTVEGSVVADAFCHSMVRALVGAVVPVGEGRYAVDVPAAVLAAGVRDPRVRVMPAHGLCLEEVRYPSDGDLARRAAQTRAVRTLTSGTG